MFTWGIYKLVKNDNILTNPKKQRTRYRVRCFFYVSRAGFEPATQGLKVPCSTN